MIIETIPVGMTQTNCYVIGCRDSGDGVVVDPGAEPTKLIDAIRVTGLAIRYVINTHGHFDHIGANAEVIAATGAPLAVHPGDVPMLRLGGGAALFGLVGPKSPEPHVMLEDGQVLEAGDLRLEVLHTPGHSPGGVTLYLENAGLAFVGDVLFAGGVGRADLPGANWETLMHSIHDVLFTLPEETVIYPGHGPRTTIAQEKRTNPWLR